MDAREGSKHASSQSIGSFAVGACALIVGCSGSGSSQSAQVSTPASSGTSISATDGIVPKSAVKFVPVTYPRYGFRVSFPLIVGKDKIFRDPGCGNEPCTLGAQSNETQISSLVYPEGDPGRYCTNKYAVQHTSQCDQYIGNDLYEVDVLTIPRRLRSVTLYEVAALGLACAEAKVTRYAGNPSVWCLDGRVASTSYLVRHGNNVLVITAPRIGPFRKRFLASFQLLPTG